MPDKTLAEHVQEHVGKVLAEFKTANADGTLTVEEKLKLVFVVAEGVVCIWRTDFAGSSWIEIRDEVRTAIEDKVNELIPSIPFLQIDDKIRAGIMSAVDRVIEAIEGLVT